MKEGLGVGRGMGRMVKVDCVGRYVELERWCLGVGGMEPGGLMQRIRVS